MFEELETVRQKCQNCTKCLLCQTRTNVVFAGGTPNSKLVLIGEAPGADEDKQGQPFVGRSGQLLDKILASVGFYRDKNIYIINTIKCRPPENRNPTPAELQACRGYLEAQLDILRPKLIVLCGKIALNSFLPTVTGISKVRGQFFSGPFASQMMPIFHPAYLLRNPSINPGSPKYLMWQDMKKLRQAYDALTLEK